MILLHTKGNLMKKMQFFLSFARFWSILAMASLLLFHTSRAWAAPRQVEPALDHQSLLAPGVDLDVTYISRTPRYEWDSAKQWPAPGEPVTFTAHVINKGASSSGSFSYQWLIDGYVVSWGSTGSLSPQAERTFSQTWNWQSGRHTVTFRVDPGNQVPESAENNNSITDFTDALSVGFWVEESVYADFNSKLNGINTHSWEDWAQYQIKTFNDLLERSKYPSAPKGVLARLRLDKIVIVPDGTLFALNAQHAPLETETDVQWGFSVDEYLNCPWAGCYDTSWNVHHELGHYLFGRVDLYGLDVQGGDVDVRDDNGNPIAGTPLLPYLAFDVVHYNSRTDVDLMSNHGSDPHFLSDHTVYSLNRDWPMGERTHKGWTYIYDLPAESKLRILDNNDQPMEGVEVSVYQAVGGDGSSGPYSQYFDNTPDVTGMTDSQGVVSLGSTPFGNIEDWGITAGVILVKLHDPATDQTRYVWVEVLDFNLAYWRGETQSYTHTVYFPQGPLRLRPSQNQITFSAGGSMMEPLLYKFDISMLGEGVDKRWTVSEPSVSWLRTIPSPGNAYQPGPLTFIVDSASLGPGVYTASVDISAVAGAVNDPQTIRVTVFVTDPWPWGLQSFSDVPDNHWAHRYIERLYSAGVTGGCSTNPLQYCPESTVTRAQMAVFLERSLRGPSYSPPAVGSSSGFGDVPADYWASAWIKQLAVDRVTAGCGSGNYCPESPVTRAEMAVFLLRSKYGTGYNPPAIGDGTGFGDVPKTHWAAAWIKQLTNEGITSGCGSSNYCPDAAVTRAEMAVFLVKTFNLP